MFLGYIILGVTFNWTSVHAILAGLTFLLFGIGRVVYRLHQRLNKLESGDDEVQTAIFGEQNNPLHAGLTREVAEIQKEIDELQVLVDDAESDREDLQRRINELNRKVERLLSRVDEDDE